MSPHEGEDLREIHLQALLLDAVDAAIIATDLGAVVTHWSKGAQHRARGAQASAEVRRWRPRGNLAAWNPTAPPFARS